MNFNAEIKSELKAITDKASRAIENSMIGALSSVTARSVVDTGRYRAAWNISTDSINGSVPDDKGKPKGHVKGTDLYGLENQSISFDVTKNTVAYLSNNVEYAKKVDARFGDVDAAIGYLNRSLKQRLG